MNAGEVRNADEKPHVGTQRVAKEMQRKRRREERATSSGERGKSAANEDEA